MRISLDYRNPPAPPGVWQWGVLLLGALLCAASVYQYHLLESERAALQLRLQAKLATPAASRAAEHGRIPARLEDQVKQANTVLGQLGVPWPTLLEHLEVTTGTGIALLSVRPDAVKGKLRLTGEAKHLTDVLRYVELLGGDKVVQNVVLEQHEVAAADTQKPIRFALSADWGKRP
jgi:hypothetical protein